MRWFLLFLLLVPFASSYTGFTDAASFSVTNNMVTASDDAIYYQGWYSADAQNWQSFTFPDAQTSGWILDGSAIKTLPDVFSEGGEHYVLIYSCSKGSWSSNDWSCHGNQWQILKVDIAVCSPQSNAITCEGECGPQTNNCQQQVDCGQCTPSSGTEIVYVNDFEDDTLGSYRSADYLQDWTIIPFVSGSDNDQSFPHASIILEGENKVFRNDFATGSLWCNNNGCFWTNNYMGVGHDELYLSYRIKVTGDWSGSKGKLPSLNGYLTDTPGGAGQCVTGVDDLSGRMMFFGKSNGIGLHFYPYHMGNWEGDFYRDSFYSTRGYYASDCQEVLEFVCDEWFCFNGVWHQEAFQSEYADFLSARGGDPNSPLEFATFIHSNKHSDFLSQYGREPNSCVEFAMYVSNSGFSLLCGVYSGSGRAIDDLTLVANTWYTFAQRVVTNDVGQKNGYVEVFIDGAFVDRLDGLEFRSIPDLKVNNVGFNAFFGGDEGDEPKSPVSMFIDDLTVFRYLSESGQPIGQQRSAPNRVLPPLSGNPVEPPACSDNAYVQCSDGDVFWFDSCDVRGMLYDDCSSSETCPVNQCVTTQPPSGDDDIALSLVNWHYVGSQDIGSWPVIDDLYSVTINSANDICTYHTMAGLWPGYRPYSSFDGSDDIVDANGWIFIKVGSTWHAGPYDWFRHLSAQECKYGMTPHKLTTDQLSSIGEIQNWNPSSGEEVCFMMTTVARNSVNQASVDAFGTPYNHQDQRSNIKCVNWP